MFIILIQLVYYRSHSMHHKLIEKPLYKTLLNEDRQVILSVLSFNGNKKKYFK